MTVNLRTATGLTAGTSTSVTYTLPTGHAAGDLLIAIYAGKPYTATVGTPGNYTAAGSVTSGTVANAASAGSTRLQVFFSIHSGSASNPTGTVSAAPSPSMVAMLAAVLPANGTWAPQYTTGSDTTLTGTSISAAGAASLSVAVGDVVLVISASHDDAATDTSPTLTIGSATFAAAVQQLTTTTTTTGNDGALYVWAFRCTAAGSGTPTYAATTTSGQSARAVVFLLVNNPASVITEEVGLSDSLHVVEGPPLAEGAVGVTDADLTADLTGGGSTPAEASGSLTLTGSGTSGVSGAAAGSGSLDLTGSGGQIAALSASGSLTLTGTAGGGTSASASGSLTLTGSADASVTLAASGSLAITGSTTGEAPQGGSGSLTLTGTATARGAATASGSLTLTGSLPHVVPLSDPVGLSDRLHVITGSVLPEGVVQVLDGTYELEVTEGIEASGSLTLTGTVRPGQGHPLTDAVDLTETVTYRSGVTAAGSLTLTGSGTGVARPVAGASLILTGGVTAGASLFASGLLTIQGEAVAEGPSTDFQGSLTLTGSATLGVTFVAEGVLDLTGSASTGVGMFADGSLTITGSGQVDGSPYGSGSLTLTGAAMAGVTAVAQGLLTLTGRGNLSTTDWVRPPRLEAHLADLLSDVGAVTVWAVDSRPISAGAAELTRYQVEVRASSKKAARQRAYEARDVILALPGGIWHDGIVLGVFDFEGPAWTPAPDGAPRYVFRCSVLYRNTRILA